LELKMKLVFLFKIDVFYSYDLVLSSTDNITAICRHFWNFKNELVFIKCLKINAFGFFFKSEKNK